jgi:hypothetical protein
LISGHRQKRQEHGSASIIAIATGCPAPGLKQPNKHLLFNHRIWKGWP